MKLSIISAIAAASVMLVGAIGSGSGSASAAAPTYLCVDGNGILCIGEQGSDLANPADVALDMDNYNLATYLIKWSHPSVSGTTGEIEDPYGFCLQVAADEDYLVRAAPCVGDTAEEWKNYYNPNTHRTEFASVWAQEALCLSYDADGDTVYADPCTPGGGSNNWYQQWGSS
jgi:hypothetical protein